ncbi:MAG TPA: hypothetical protein VFX59_15385 [Polyangiales bacterium]|nr:hypothetical protein [Polyangiales bacterium]
MKHRVVLGVLLSSVMGLGCASSQGQRVNDARMAEIEAREREQLAAIEARTSSRSDGIEKVGDQHEQALEASDQPGADARGELAEVSTEREQYRNDATGRLDKLTVRLEAAKEKTDVLGARAPTSLHQELETAQTAHKLLKQRVSELGAVQPAQWGQNKEELERGLDLLGERIANLNKSIGDV